MYPSVTVGFYHWKNLFPLGTISPLHSQFLCLMFPGAVLSSATPGRAEGQDRGSPAHFSVVEAESREGADLSTRPCKTS